MHIDHKLTLRYKKGAKNIQWGKSLFNKWYWQNWTQLHAKNETGPLSTPHTEINKNGLYKTWNHKTPRRKY